MANQLVINADLGETKINRNIYGHFAEHLGRCIYDGMWVGEDSPIPNTRGIRQDLVDALREMRIPVLRWPGGCFADEYHWMDGVGPKARRPAMVNTHWGMVTENNHFGTHEFLDLCDLLGCEPYICGNVGSGTVLEMQQWVEYVTFGGESPMSDLRRANGREEPWRAKYWGVGNENWGCGGRMRPEYYADLYRRFQTYLRNLSENELFKIACGPSGANYHWTEVLMREAGDQMDGLSMHYYTRFPDTESQSATQFGEAEWFGILQGSLRMDEIVGRHSTIMDRYDPAKRVALIVDEWGTWYDVEPGTNPRFLYQQNTIRDALVAGMTLNILNTYANRVRMANIAQTINVLQAMALTRDGDMLLTPTYHVFEMYKVHQDATLLPSELVCADYVFGEGGIPQLSASASLDSNGRIHITLCNLDPASSATLSVALRGANATAVTGRALTAGNITAHNTFEAPEQVKPAAYSKAHLAGDGLAAELPPMSVVALTITSG